MSFTERTAWAVFIISTLYFAFSDGNCNNEEKGSFGIIGVFDFADVSSKEAFENAASRHNSKECVPKFINRTLLIKNDSSVSELIDLAQNTPKTGPCFMVYATEDSKARIVLEFAITQGINVVTAISPFYPNYQNSGMQLRYDPHHVSSINRVSSVETKRDALLALIGKLNWSKFFVMTDDEPGSNYFVNLLKESLGPRNLNLTDWLVVFEHEDLYHHFEELGNDVNNIILITNNLLLVKEVKRSDFVDDALSSISRVVTGNGRKGKAFICPKVSEFKRLLSEVSFHGSSDPVQFDQEGKRVPLRYDVNKLEYNEEEEIHKLEHLGYWSNGKLFMEKKGESLKILLNEYPPNVISQPKKRGEPCQGNSKSCIKIVEGQEIERCCYGFVIDVVNVMCKEMGKIPELLFTLDGQYGVYDEVNNSWNGVVSELLIGRGDISFDLYISSRRADVVDFTEPYMPSGIRLLAKDKKREDNQIYWVSYLRPFTPPVWLTLLGSLGIMIIFLWVMDKISPVRGSKKLFHPNSSFGLDNAVCFALALAFGRPADESKPKTNGARLSSVAFGMAMLVFVSTYSANLAAFLIVDDKSPPVEDIYDIKIERPPDGFKYGTIDGSYMADYFKNSKNTYFRHVWYHMKQNNVKSLREGVEAVKSGSLDVFVADHVGLEYESRNDPNCELRVVGEPFAMSGASIAVKKSNPLFIQVSEALQSIKARGLTDYIQEFWVSKYKCPRETPPAQLKVEDLSGLFLQLTIAMIGCLLGTFCHRIFLQMREKWTSNSNEDTDEQDVKQGFSQTETLV
ncbi:Glutamate receptor ionotropic, NMDA 1 [Stylophora pistillata]|uniref:Glutamate receptor ionotropic, NMDA 1 n=1 Tax=Stylophora pistillata TaxID=50429 RepID=A0A2B4S1A0_STYPI|nr:Glutamate receptor ionotropic, NMDA 1 [Stylophora pistillata]